MRNALVLMLVIWIVVVLIAVGCQKPLVGESCGTVSPDSRDTCCAEKMKDKPHVMCTGNWKYNGEKDVCIYECENPSELGKCGDFPSEQRDACCAKVMKDQPHVRCLGNWKYILDTSKCGYVCELPEEENSQIANPASVKCIEDGGELKIVDSPDGQYGLCNFPDGTVCEEWAYFRGECKKGNT